MMGTKTTTHDVVVPPSSSRPTTRRRGRRLLQPPPSPQSQPQQQQEQEGWHRQDSKQRSHRIPRILATATMGLFLPTETHSRPEPESSSIFSNGIIPQTRTIPFITTRQDGGETLSNGTVYATCPDLSYITGPMYEADVDQNGFLSQDEYVQFTDAISGGYLTQQGWSDSFTDMPLSLQETYLVLSCLCELYEDQPWGGEGCCAMNHLLPDGDTGIRTDGTAPDETPDEIQLNYLTYVCGTMSESLEVVGGMVVAPPTVEPTGRPTGRPTEARPSLEPTKEPSKKPTPEPTTPEPTKQPTPEPTTPSPTKAATQPPTVLPPNTPFPTEEAPPVTPFPTEPMDPTPPPTPLPTLQPVVPVTPTKEPTAQPTVGTPPTTEPTSEPTTKPTVEDGVPTKSPTPQPTSEPVPPGTPTKSPTAKPTDPTVDPTRKPTPPPVGPGAPSASPVAADLQPSMSPTRSQTQSPTISFVPTPTPTVSFMPSVQPTSTPSAQPSISILPTTSTAPSDSPSTSLRPSLSAAPSRFKFTGEVPASVDFVASLNGEVSAEEIMAGETNQVKIMLEEQLLVLSDIVILEEFYNINETMALLANGGRRMESAGFVRESSSNKDEPPKLRGGRKERVLRVEKATLATVDSVEDVACPQAEPNGAASGPIECLNFNNTILLSMVDEYDVEEKVKIFEDAMLAKIADGWLAQNFDLEEALKPPLAPPSPSPTRQSDTDKGITPTQPETLEPQSLSAGAIIGIIIAVLICFVLTFMYGDRYKREKSDMERQQELKDSQAAQADLNAPQDRLDPSYEAQQGEVDDASSMSTTTADRSFSSQEHLLGGIQRSSTVDLPPALGEMKEEESEVEDSVFSIGDISMESDVNRSDVSGLAAMGTASTLVASSTPDMTPSREMESYSPINFADSASTATTEFPIVDPGGIGSAISASSTSSPLSAGWPDEDRGRAGAAMAGGAGGAAGGRGFGGGQAPATAGEEGGLTAGAAAAIGAAGAGVVAAGAYAMTRNRSTTPEAEREDSSRDESTRGDSRTALASTPSSVPNAMDDLDNAIESGNWGQVGALAAVLASQTQGSAPPPQARKSSSRGGGAVGAGISSSTSHDSSGGSGSGQGSTLDQARAVEIDKLVEAGDWQGVVLAAARFEADQTFDEGSFSASASQSSRWTGSATSATTPRSMATTDQSASNISSQRGQEEIRAEVEALVRRVVPEEADNIEEMMTQFKGREEELVETLRRMQERAIASRARLAVQKSAKLEARSKASSRSGTGTGGGTGGGNASSAASVGSVNSTKSELEEAIESGNWLAVGAAAQKMSDASIGDLSDDDKARLRDAISKSPAFSRSRSGASTPGAARGRAPSEDYDLDKLIERGDWPGVIAAAKAASEGPDKSISMEEQDALAQANMWQEIADQSKQDAGQGPAGAGDAAAWAISRSLNAMNSPDSSSAAVRTIADIADADSSDASQYESSSYGDSAGRSHEDYGRRGI